MARKLVELPGFLPFQHPKLVEQPPDGPGWVHEVKLDGYRTQLRIEKGRATWFTRNGLDWTDRFPDLSAEVARLTDCIVDGELVAIGPDGSLSFSALRGAVGRRQIGKIDGELVYYAFDLLYAPDDLRGLPLAGRRERLAELIGDGGAYLAIVQPVEGRAADLAKAACAMGLEGIVSKRLDAPYTGGDARPLTWQKVKCRPGQEVVIAGWRDKGASLQGLLAGVYDQGQLMYVGSVQTGFGGKTMDILMPKLWALRTNRSPFAATSPKPGRHGGDLHFVRPELVARVEFAEWTASGKLRQSSFKGLREDKAPSEVIRETPARVPSRRDPPARSRGSRLEVAELHGVPITNPEKALWPGFENEPPITKMDLARYYAAASEWLLPYIRGRPCTVVMAPDGIRGEVTWVRHEGHWQGPLQESPLLGHITVEDKGKTYPSFDTVQALVLAADLAVVEFHPWNSVPGDPSLPGRLVFDLDPDEGQTFGDLGTAAEELETRLLDLGLLSFVKLSGQRGLHVVVPLEQFSRNTVSWLEARTFAETLCRQMAADSPARYTVALPKAKRGGRLFLDYLRNDPGHHAVGLLSPRTTPAGTVSMPKLWSALRTPVSPDTLRSALRHLRTDNPWAYFEQCARPIRYAVDRLSARRKKAF